MNNDESKHYRVGEPQGNIEHHAGNREPDPSLMTRQEHVPVAPEEGGDRESFGSRLRAARLRRGMDLLACGQALHLPARLLKKLEEDDYEGIDYSVYLRSYLDKYASYLELGEDAIRAQLESLQTRQPVLVSMNRQPWWQRTLSRYSSAATYLVLTAVIVVPLIWLGLNGVLKRDIAKLTPLDAAPVGAHSAALNDGLQLPAPAGIAVAGQKPVPAASEKPLMASMTPFSAMEHSEDAGDAPDAAPAPAPATQPVTAPPAGNRLTLDLQNQSWVEIVDDTGARLEYALLPAGTHKSYRSSKPLDVRIGNADGASMDVDGKPLALDRFQHANVAHFDIAADGTAKPANG